MHFLLTFEGFQARSLIISAQKLINYTKFPPFTFKLFVRRYFWLNVANVYIINSFWPQNKTLFFVRIAWCQNLDRQSSCYVTTAPTSCDTFGYNKMPEVLDISQLVYYFLIYWKRILERNSIQRNPAIRPPRYYDYATALLCPAAEIKKVHSFSYFTTSQKTSPFSRPDEF